MCAVPSVPEAAESGTLCHGDGPMDGATAAGVHVTCPHRFDLSSTLCHHRPHDDGGFVCVVAGPARPAAFRALGHARFREELSMRVAIPRQLQQRCGRTRCPDRGTLRRLRATAALLAILELCWPVNARACPRLTVVNALPRSSVCPLGNSVSVFSPGQQSDSARGQFLRRQRRLFKVSRSGHSGEQLVLDGRLLARAKGRSSESRQLRGAVRHIRPVCPIASTGLVREGHSDIPDRHGDRREHKRWMPDHNYPQQLYGCGDAELLRSSGDREQHVCRSVGNHQQPRR